MPISDQSGYETGHFSRVFNDIIEPACEKAGYKAVRADQIKETNLIHLDILQKIIDSPIAICDLSSRNPNVLFELGLRQAFDKPVVLIQEQGTPQIFDITPLRYTVYRPELKYREVLEDQLKIKDAIEATVRATSSEKGQGINSLVKLLSISTPARLPENGGADTELEFQVLRAELNQIRTQLRDISLNLSSPQQIAISQSEQKVILDSEISKLNKLADEIERNVSLGLDTKESNIKRSGELHTRIIRLITSSSDVRTVNRLSSLANRVRGIENAAKTTADDNDLPF